MTPEAAEKAESSRQMARRWRQGLLGFEFPLQPPERPARPERPQLLAPREMPRRRKAGSLTKRIALLHAIAHIELNAIDLAWDMVARFGPEMPRAFTDDWVRVGKEEANHFNMLEDRLNVLGSHYGALPAHDALWQAATRTRHDLAARLAVVPLVLEARGLDVTPAMIERLKAAGDPESAAALEIIYAEEVGHVAAGRRWFEELCERRSEDPAKAFRRLLRRYHPSGLKPPFNEEARSRAGLEKAYYQPQETKKP